LEVQIAEKVAGVTQEDFKKYQYFKDRTLHFTEYAAERNTSLYVDAEQTFIQYGIESFGQQLTHKLNRGSRALIMNGYQCYTKRTENLIPMEVQCAQEFDYNLGVKLIRGAYMNEERELAEQQGVESPIWDTLEETHKCYNENMQHIITNMSENDMILVASHNVDTVNLATSLIDDTDLKQNERVVFGQLRGFSDNVTGQLSSDGYKVYKYVPFGPTEQVMPYLVRRGQESRQVLREQKFQNEVLSKEIRKRILKF
jgi:proline dehydrogenase